MVLLEEKADKDHQSEPLGIDDDDDGSRLPSYSDIDLTADSIRGPQPHCIHTYELAPGSKDQPWFTLEVFSNATSAKHKPVFVGTLPLRITGCVRLSLTAPERIIRVKVKVCGKMTVPGYHVRERDFFVAEQILFASSPDMASKKPSFFASFLAGAKLDGDHAFDFSLELPESLSLQRFNSEDTFRDCPFPPTYEDINRLRVSYWMTAELERPNPTPKAGLNTSIMLMPLTFPPRYGAMRKAVYAAGAAQLLGPRESPNSWESIPPHELEGTLFDGSRKLEMTCILSLAKPLQYTRGSFIPCHLLLFSSDEEALTLLSSPSAVKVQLIVVAKTPPAKTDQPRMATPKVARGLLAPDELGYIDSRPIQLAVWWPSPVASSSSREGVHTRELFGEIHLPARIALPVSTPDLQLSYKVALMPFDAKGYDPPAQAAGVPLHSSLPHSGLASGSISALAVANDRAFAEEHKAAFMPVDVTGYNLSAQAADAEAPAEDRGLLLADVDIVSAYAPGGDPRPIQVQKDVPDKPMSTQWSFYRRGPMDPHMNLFVGK